MDLLTKEFPTNYPQDAVDVLTAMSFTGGRNVMILGSMSLRSQQYAGDYDAFEVVERDGNRPFEDLADDFQSIIKKLRGMPNTFIGDIKAGSIEEWRVLSKDAGVDNGRIVNYNASQSRSKLDQLYKDKVISKNEHTYSEKLLKDKPTAEEFLLARKQLKFHLVRWSVADVLAGAKRLRDGRTFTLEEAFQSPTIAKLDVIGFVQNNRYTDFSIIYEFHINGEVVNKDTVDIAKSLSEDIVLYKSENKPFKMIKRQFALAKFQGDTKTIKRLTPILNSDLGRLYSLSSDLGTLIVMLEDYTKVPLKEIRFELDQFKGRMANIYTIPDFLKEEHDLIGHLNSALKMSNRAQLVSRLREIQKSFDQTLNRNTEKALRSKGQIDEAFRGGATHFGLITVQ